MTTRRRQELKATHRLVQDLALLLAAVTKVLPHALVALALLPRFPVAAFLDLVVVLLRTVDGGALDSIARLVHIAAADLFLLVPPPALLLAAFIGHDLAVRLLLVALVQREVVPQAARVGKDPAAAIGVAAGRRVDRLVVALEERPGAKLAGLGGERGAVRVHAGVARGCWKKRCELTGKKQGEGAKGSGRTVVGLFVTFKMLLLLERFAAPRVCALERLDVRGFGRVLLQGVRAELVVLAETRVALVTLRVQWRVSLQRGSCTISAISPCTCCRGGLARYAS